MSAIELSNGTLWKVCDFQYNYNKKTYQFTRDYDSVLCSMDELFFTPAPGSSKLKLHITYSSDYDEYHFGDYGYWRCDDGLLFMNCTHQLIKVQRHIKERLARAKQNRILALAMVTHPRLGGGNSSGSDLTGDVMMLIASKL